MDLIPEFILATAVAVAGQLSDYFNTAGDIHKNGLSGEQNPIFKKLWSINQYLPLAYKLGPIGLLIYGAIHFRDLTNVGVNYVNGPGKDYWGYAWCASMLAVGLFGLIGRLLSKKA